MSRHYLEKKRVNLLRVLADRSSPIPRANRSRFNSPFLWVLYIYIYIWSGRITQGIVLYSIRPIYSGNNVIWITRDWIGGTRYLSSSSRGGRTRAIITFPPPLFVFARFRTLSSRQQCLPSRSEGHGVNTMSTRDTEIHPADLKWLAAEEWGEGERLHQHREGDRIRVFVLYEDYQPVRFHLEGWHPRGVEGEL